MSWDLFSGFTGEINFGHAVFIGIGSYVAGILNSELGVPPIFTIIFAAIITFIIAGMLGALTLRVKGPYFAIVTMAVNIIFSEVALVMWQWTRAEEGIPGLDCLTNSPMFDFYLSVFFTFVTFVCLMIVTRSKYGTILLSIRENDIVASASGINVTFYRIITFAVSGLIFGSSGAFFAHLNMHAGIENIELFLSATVLIMAIFGGIGTIAGPMLGAYCMILLSEYFRFIEEYRMLVYSAIILIVIFLLPQGVYPPIRDMLRNFSKRLLASSEKAT
jgi:branched-chain amino acid transport system permease protein